MSCSITLTNDTFRKEIISCSQGMFRVTIGSTYDYNVTVTNFLGATSISNSTSKFYLIIHYCHDVSKNVGQETN